MNLLKILLLFIISFTFNYAKQENVNLQLQWKHQFQFAGYYMAKEKGYYDDVNLNVTLLEHTIKNDTLNDILSQKTNYAIGRTSLINKRSHGKKVVLLASILQSSPLALVTKKASGINTLKDFKNKRLSITNTEAETSIFPLLLSHNITKNDIDINYSFNKVDDFINNKTDVITLYTSNQEYTLIKKGIRYNIFHPKDFNFDFYDDILFTSQKEINQHPNRTIDFKNASLKGWRYAFDNIEETIDIILKKYNTQNKTRDDLQYEANVLKKLAYLNTTKIGQIDPNKIQSIYAVYNVMGLTGSSIDMEQFIFNPPTKQEKITKNPLTKEELYYLKKNPVVKMCNNPSWEPIEFAEHGDINNISGIAIDTLRLIEKELNIRFQTIPTESWTQSQQFLKEKKCDILPAAIETENRKKYANFTQPYIQLPLAIFTAKDKPLINGLDEIIHEPWARHKGSGLIQTINKKYPNNNLIAANSSNEAFQFVNNGTAYFTIATLPVATNLIHKYQLDNLQIAGYSNIIYKLSVAVRNDKPILLNILNKSLLNISQIEHRNILKAWVNINEQPVLNSKIFRNILLILFFFAIFLFYRQYLLKKTNSSLQSIVNEKTSELKELNNNLEIKIKDAIHENREKDKILANQAKMVSMGEMIGNIAHQWRQPLSVISTGVTGMQVQKEYGLLDDKQFHKTCTMINDNAQYLSKTIDDFKNFILGDRQKKIFYLLDSLHTFKHLIEGSINKNEIELILDIDKRLQINGYENELVQCVINIFNNSKDALIENKIENKIIIISASEHDGFIILDIQDNAKGIDLDIINKIFEPYFTTKHKSQGTGIGLNMTYKLIVNGMKGTITAKNKTFMHNNISYNGALFQIAIPVS